MAISELQVALIGAGTAAVAAVWGYNAWQERRHRKTADMIFKGGQGDALLGTESPGPADEPPAGAYARHEPGEWQAPEIPDGEVEVQTVGDEGDIPSVSDAPVEDPPQSPKFPQECADEVADCVLRFSAPEPIPAPAVWAIQNAWSGALSKPVHWLVREDADDIWRQVDSHEGGRFREWAVALQLVDRRGPVSDGELARFFDGLQQLAQQTSATLELPSRGEMVLRAGDLDEFCAAVDIQFVLHVVEGLGGAFAGTKLRGVAEAAGLILEADGVFRARDAAGSEMFTVANSSAERLDAESIKSLATHGLTLSMDVPRVADGVAAFDRMLATAQQLAATLGGALVDAQRAPLSLDMINAIRARTAELQQFMRDGHIAPGSVRALRLFS